MCDRVHTDLVSLSMSMIEVGVEIKMVLERWDENRRGWVSDEVCSSVKRRKRANKEYMKMIRVCGVNDYMTEKDKEYYFKEKEEAKEIVREMFCLKENANLNVRKVMVYGGMKYGGEHISMTELENAIKDMKEKKDTDESGLIAEYLKALKDGSKEELRMLLNDVIDGGDIPLQWKESRVVLVYKGCDMSEFMNYRPKAIINVICKLCMIIVRDRMNRWVEESGMLGDVQGGFKKGRRAKDNIFIVDRLIEMTRRRKACLLVAFIDM